MLFPPRFQIALFYILLYNTAFSIPLVFSSILYVNYA